ncbi:MAG: GIY-YIG nuclease family protein [Bacteroidales bacterium]|nr:GIY-YIG nuclease family protein [Bacteroidales bacterium]
MKKRNYYVYIVTNKNNTVLYTGVTNNLVRRMHEHKTKFNKGFTAKYNVSKLVYFEQFVSVKEAILREKRIKKWKREWKERLIREKNPEWIDLTCNLS